jgi:hypothetical protein
MSKTWANPLWEYLFAMAITYPEKNPSSQKIFEMKNFLKYMGKTLPCPKCSAHFKKIINGDYSVYGMSSLDDNVLSSNKLLFKWIFKAKNFINEYQGIRNSNETVSQLYQKYIDKYNE